jgi:hypothetical protein
MMGSEEGLRMMSGIALGLGLEIELVYISEFSYLFISACIFIILRGSLKS